MDTNMNDYLERERLHNVHRRYSIAIQQLRLKQVISRNCKRHNDHHEQLKIAQKNDLTLTLSSLEGICQQLQQKEETLNDLRSVVRDSELRPAIVRFKYEHDENLKRSKDATIEKKKAMIKRVKETLQRIPKVREIDAISKNIENSKAQLKAADKMVQKECVQIKSDEEKHQKDVNGLHKIIHNLNETIQIAEQELQQLENECNSGNDDDSAVSSQKSLIEENVLKVHAKTPSKDEKEEEEEDLTISPIKIVELDFSMRETPQSNRAQWDVFGGLNWMSNVPNIGKQTAIGDQSLGTRKSYGTPQPMTTTNDSGMRSETPKPPIVEKDVAEAGECSSRSSMESNNKKSHTVTSEMVQQSASATDASNVPNNRIHGNASGCHRLPGGSNLMLNVPNIAKQTAIGDQSSETPQPMKTTNDPKMCPETPKPPIVEKNVDEAAKYSSRSNMESYNKKSHTVTSGMLQQSSSATDASNASNNRIHGNASDGHRVSGGSNLMPNVPNTMSNVSDTSVDRSPWRYSNDLIGMSRVIAQKPTATNTSSIAANNLASAPRSADQFADSNLLPPLVQKRKATSDQSEAIKKQCTGSTGDSHKDGGQRLYGFQHGRGAPEPKTQVNQPISQFEMNENQCPNYMQQPNYERDPKMNVGSAEKSVMPNTRQSFNPQVPGSAFKDPSMRQAGAKSRNSAETDFSAAEFFPSTDQPDFSFSGFESNFGDASMKSESKREDPSGKSNASEFDFAFDGNFNFEQSDNDSNNVPGHSGFDDDGGFI